MARSRCVLAILPHHVDVLFALDPVAVAPELRAGRSNFDIQALVVRELVGLRLLRRVADAGVVEHGGYPAV